MAAIINVDVIINGAGIVGRTMAVALADLGLTVALVDPKPVATTMTDKVDARVFAINQTSQHILQNLNVWPRLQQDRLGPYDKIDVWNNSGHVHYDAGFINQPQLGHVIEQQVLQAALAAAIEDNDQIQIITGRAKALKNFSDEIHLLLEDGQHLQASLLIGADGAHSWVRQQTGIQLNTKDYGQTAIVATITTEKPHQNVARQRFLKTGPLVHLPLFDQQRCSIVWTAERDYAEDLLEMGDQTFCEAVSDAMQSCLGRVTAVSERYSFHLIQRHAEKYVAPNIALLGDAMHTIHPLAGLGLNLGLLDAATLRDVIVARVKQKLPLGQESALLDYQRQRRAPVVATIAAMAMFKQLFSNDNFALDWLRNSGFKLTDQQLLLKTLFMQHAATMQLQLPMLAK